MAPQGLGDPLCSSWPLPGDLRLMYEIGASWPGVHKNLIIRSRKYYGPWSWRQVRRIEGRNDAGTDRAEAAGPSCRAGPHAEAGGGACPGDPPDPDGPGERQAAPLHADPDEDRQGLRRAPRGVGGGGVADRTIPTVGSPFLTPSVRSSSFFLPLLTRARGRVVLRTSPQGGPTKFAFIWFSEVCIDPSSILGVVYSAARIFNKFRRGKLLLDAVDGLRDRFHDRVGRLPPVLPEPDLGRLRRFV